MRIVVVGPCASGKTTLVGRLRDLGLDALNVAQEHSGIRALWRKKRPDVLVMLEASLPVIRRRRPVPWGEERLTAQRERLKDARAHADLFIQTDSLTREEVTQRVLDYIAGRTDNDGDNGSNPEERP
jgi:GTPase SAR1 and related small G proteins